MKYKVLYIFFASCILYSCTTELGSNCDDGIETIEKRIIDLESLTKIELSMSGNIFIEEGEQFIEIEAPSDIIDKILEDSTVGSEKWEIDFNGCYNGHKVNIWVTLPKFVDLKISGSGNLATQDVLRNISNLKLEIDGSGEIEVELADAIELDVEIQGSGDITIDARDVQTHSYDVEGSGDITSTFREGDLCRVRIEGSGNITLAGVTGDTFIDIEGNGDVQAFELCSHICNIKIEGSGDSEVKVDNKLNVGIEGSGNVCFKGQPMITSVIDGSGKINDCN